MARFEKTAQKGRSDRRQFAPVPDPWRGPRTDLAALLAEAEAYREAQAKQADQTKAEEESKAKE